MSMRWKNFFYEMVDGGVVITDYEQGAEDVLCIPPQIAGYPVVEIGEEAFSENGLLLTKIEVPFSVRRIGRGAFKMCLNLTELVLHDGLESIGAEALYLTPLTELLLPDTVREIEEPW
ncbi:MAG: leucine-rich repeat domain-containing protein, partial [Clostridiales bacterium]|nr:leucine-rich repeat domain-containing protein [Clostridiales bacterium]